MPLRASAGWGAAWAIGLVSIAGCNAVLGIDAPTAAVRDANVAAPLDGMDDPVHVGAGQGDAGAEEDAAGPALPVSEFAWPDWPMPNPLGAAVANPQTFATRQEGVVSDATTQLEWQQTVDDELRSWAEAAEYCAQLELAGGGFRLPARIELLSLLDFTRASPPIDTLAFPDAPADRFWSSSPFAGSRANVWLINFEFGTGFSFQAHKNEKHRVRCVR